MEKVMFWKKIQNGVQCELCPRNCIILDGNKGFCGARKNENEKITSLVYGKACSVAIDPIEKKPFFHFAPGSQTLSIATVGCNLRCLFCQNAEISQPKDIFGEDMEPAELVVALKQNGLPGFSWTYTEPTIFYEYFYDTAKLAGKKFYNTWVSNGFTNAEPIKKAAEFLNAVNIDYKGPDKFYHEVCSAWLEPVQKSIKLHKKLGVWVEITNLVIPSYNDKDEHFREMCEWIFENLGPGVPVHFSRFFPCHKLRAPVTPLQTLERAAKIAEKAGINYVYIGNIGNQKENTYCHNCKGILIERAGYIIKRFMPVKKGDDYHCPSCSAKIPLAGMQWSPFGR